MKTYQDLLNAGQDEQSRMDFIQTAVNDMRGSREYRLAADAELYYYGENPTINRYEKIIYDMQGRAHRDMYTANHKIASRFFGFAVDQENSYLLGNGVTFEQDGTKDRLGADFDQRVQEAGEYALTAGVAFGFWNFDRLQVFRLTEFVPLYDEENGALMAGIRWWQVAPDKPLRATLYEPDGFTEYIRPKDKTMTVLRPKQHYQKWVRTDGLNNMEIYDGDNYPGFPIVPLKNNRKCASELLGKRNTVDALDLACSNMINNVDEGNLIYWVLTNAGGMSDMDDAKFLERVKLLHVAHTDNDAAPEPHTIEAPYQGTNTTIDMLKKKLYEDFQCFDASAVSAGNQTATAIKASYVPLDLKCDKFERQVTDFIHGILEIAGIDDNPSYTRNQIINKQEETQTVLLGASYYDDEYITKKLLTILGDADQYGELMKRKQAEDMEKLEEVDDGGLGGSGDGQGTEEAGAQNRQAVSGSAGQSG